MNYRPISRLCIISKTLERCVFSHCYPLLAPKLYHLQHGFLKGRSTVTQLLEVYHDILACLDIIHLDLSKAFDLVPHHLLLFQLDRYGISGSLCKWFKSYLADRQQRVVLNGSSSDWLPVTSGGPQGSILGPLLSLVYANDMSNYVVEGCLALFADYSKLYRPIVSSSDCRSLQSDLNHLH